MPESHTSGWSTLLMVFRLAILCPGTGVASAPAGQEPLCGPLCLAFLLRQWDLPVDGDVLLRETHYARERGTTLFHLQRCAESHGLRCLPIKAPLTWIILSLNSDTCAILSQSNHFVVLVKNADRVLFLDPSTKLIMPIGTEGLSDRYLALLVSRCDIPVWRLWGFHRIASWVATLCTGISVVLFGVVCIRRHRQPRCLPQTPAS